MTLNSLGKVYHELGLLTKSLAVLQRSQSITANFFAPDHPQVYNSLMVCTPPLSDLSFVSCGFF